MKSLHIIIGAPSGAGKTTIVGELLKHCPDHCFSVSATTRAKRGGEVDGVNYYFLDKKTFLKKKDNKEFAEWEEVYAGCFYGTLKKEIERIEEEGKKVIFDVDVNGAESLKDFFGKEATSIFIMPPSIKVLEERLKSRKTDSSKKIKERIAKARAEIRSSRFFDFVVVNDILEDAVKECIECIECIETFLD